MHRTSAAPGEPPAQSGIAALLGGDAIAVGDSTSATGVVTNTVEHIGNATVAFGEAAFTAVGSSSGHGAQAATDTFLQVTGADLVFEVTFNIHGGNGATAFSESVTEYVAIDLPNWTPGGGTHVAHMGGLGAIRHALGLVGFGHLPMINPLDGLGGLPGGNFAHDVATAQAFGPNTLAETSTLALTVQHQLSAVSASALVAA